MYKKYYIKEIMIYLFNHYIQLYTIIYKFIKYYQLYRNF